MKALFITRLVPFAERQIIIMEPKYKIQLIYLAIISVIGIVITIYDKIAAKKAPRHRVPEAALVTVGVLGGALGMYIVMQIIRHKTRKPKFSVGFPIIILLQAAAVTAVNAWVLN